MCVSVVECDMILIGSRLYAASQSVNRVPEQQRARVRGDFVGGLGLWSIASTMRVRIKPTPSISSILLPTHTDFFSYN